METDVDEIIKDLVERDPNFERGNQNKRDTDRTVRQVIDDLINKRPVKPEEKKLIL